MYLAAPVTLATPSLRGTFDPTARVLEGLRVTADRGDGWSEGDGNR
jgi:hypothetical protein